ncbi:MAG: DUF2911 domain-containing protein [Terriglobia bacterium]
MKKIVWGLVVLCLLSLPIVAQTPAEAPKDRGEANLTLGDGKIAIDYGRPALGARDITKMIEPGMEWRMGSNAPTTLSTDIALKFGEKKVPKGKYVLKAKLVEAGKWHLMIYKEKEVVAEVPLTLGKSSQPAELVTIKLEKAESPMSLEKDPKNSQKMTIKGMEGGTGGKFTLEWGNLNLSTTFQKG